MSASGLCCRFCATPLRHSFADLGTSPLANSYLTPEQLSQGETFYPLHAYVCEACFLVQLGEFAPPAAIFGDYAYFSSVSDSWVDHARRYADTMIRRLGLGASSQVIEVASNDGYLLQFFQQQGVGVLGVEPAANVARTAIDRGIPTVVRFFGRETARSLVASGSRADLLVGNNVLAHVPDINDFVAGVHEVLAPEGRATFEFPHLLRLMEETEFDTIYHEHFSYLSLLAVSRIFAAHALTVVEVEELPTHGGSLRVHARRSEAAGGVDASVSRVLQKERAAGLDRIETYTAFQHSVLKAKRELLKFLSNARRHGRSVVAYGAAAKGNTLLNYCGIRNDFLDYVVDRSPHKQGRFLPGTRLPIYAPERISETRPDYILILPWNLREEIVRQMAHVHSWGCRFVVPIPTVRVLQPAVPGHVFALRRRTA
ncbi:MAG TPA: class I SAM-dependent methyltransferase [Gemmatimonadales bacterium]|nr:class I SAM-dependent methyltransferase [Gemmatimonadales bacterium]